MSQGKEFNIREGIGSDLPFIFDSFLKSYKKTSFIGRSCRNGIFFDSYRLIVDRILEQSKVLVACHKTEPQVIFGYMIFNKTTLHYVFVKEPFWELGIANALYQEASQSLDQVGFTSMTHKTLMSDRIQSLKIPYNPFLLYAGINQ